jgi:hypothetical protein
VLQNNQTFAIAGLLNNSMTATMTKIPASATFRSSACCSAARRRRRTAPSWS